VQQTVGEADLAPARTIRVMPTTARSQLDARVIAFLQAPNVASLATVGDDGTPHQAVIWYRLNDDGTLLVNSRAPRRWPAELARSRRASLAIVDEGDGMRWVGLACSVVEIDDDLTRARADIVALAHRYGDTAPGTIAAFMTQQRISFRLRIDAVHDHLAGD
jgi:hypothetical protein